jgi:hypothetical protein
VRVSSFVRDKLLAPERDALGKAEIIDAEQGRQAAELGLDEP